MSEPSGCECLSGPTLIFACSGAADVGEISDLAARKLTKDGVGKMFCLAGVGGRVGGIMDKTKAARRVLAIDGCQLDCARLTLELADIQDFSHLRITDLGMEKGKTSATLDAVAQVASQAESLLGRQVAGGK
ncbi:MAG: putative zinc-binding protein [Phycisphaerales bacterium]|nr:MAG: putative zinc-binding protein [Phycisphaerales bacterium]